MFENFLSEINIIREKYKGSLEYTRYLPLICSLILFYFYFNSLEVLKPNHVLIVMAAIGIASCLKPWLGLMIFALAHVFVLAFINFYLALIYALVYFVFSFSLVYYKNNIIFISIIYMLAMCTNTFELTIALVLYGVLFAQRKFGFPLLISFLILLSLLSSPIFGNVILFPKEVVFDPSISIVSQLDTIINNPDILKQFQSGIQVFDTKILAGVSIAFYIFFRMLFSYGKKDKLNQSDEIEKSTKTAIFCVLILMVIDVAISIIGKSDISLISLSMIVLGGLLVFLLTLFIIRYPLSDTPTLEEVQKQKELENLDKVIKNVEKKNLNTGWDDIAGYEDVKRELKEVLEPYLNKDIMKKMKEKKIEPIKGLLLFGAPGTGKTLFAKAIAKESHMNIISVAGAEFTSKWVGESDRNLRNIFEQAMIKAPCIIFFDELESFLPKREEALHSWEKTLVTTFLAQMDGFNKLKDVLVIGATNYPDKIDPAAIRAGRFDKCIYISEPDVNAKVCILKKYLGETSSLPEEDLIEIAKVMERFTAADIEALIKEMYRQKKYQTLTKEDIIGACSSYKPSITLDMRDQYERLSEKYNRRFVLDKEVENKKKEHSWDEIAGMDDVKRQIRKMVEKPLLYADKYKELDLEIPKGVLMFGPPGCGKTLFAKVIASECNASFFTVNGPELLTGAVGESEKKLRRVFRDAREQKPSIIFFDEFDSIAQNRDTMNGQVKMINQLLTEMDGMEGLEGVMVLAATNRIHDIDPALKRPGRFDNVLYIGLPDVLSREKQFAYYLAQFEGLDFTELAMKSENFTCADINGVCRKIKEKKLDNLINDKNIIIDQELCLTILSTTNKTLSDNEIQFYELMRSNERV